MRQNHIFINNLRPSAVTEQEWEQLLPFTIFKVTCLHYFLLTQWLLTYSLKNTGRSSVRAGLICLTIDHTIAIRHSY